MGGGRDVCAGLMNNGFVDRRAVREQWDMGACTGVIGAQRRQVSGMGGCEASTSDLFSPRPGRSRTDGNSAPVVA